jgi:hypothetical protein
VEENEWREHDMKVQYLDEEEEDGITTTITKG